jgi:calcium permeable stress-gated cation channel
VDFSTGKRRYGHPALNGVLPTPWLPLKKGQTLANGQRNGASHGKADANDAVVLTLRKRNSLNRRSRRVSATNRRASASNLNLLIPELHNDDSTPASAPPADTSSSSNPWQDAHRTGGTALRSQTMPNQPHQLTHRLSYDHASGIIMLPDDSWLDDEDRDSDSDYGSTPSPASGPEVSIHEGTAGTQHQNAADSGTPGGVAAPGAIALENSQASSSSSGPITMPSKRRYATYFHRPERRRQQQTAAAAGGSGAGGNANNTTGVIPGPQ